MLRCVKTGRNAAGRARRQLNFHIIFLCYFTAVLISPRRQMVGIISIGDVAKHRLHELERESAALHDYIQTAQTPLSTCWSAPCAASGRALGQALAVSSEHPSG